MSRKEMKARARDTLGNNLFGTKWLIALLVILIVSTIEGALGGVSFGIITLLVTGPLAYSMYSMFLKQARTQEEMNFNDLLSGFTTDFGGNFLLALMTTIFLCLWSLLFIFPAIIKAYAYGMVWLIKADHPEYGWNETITASRHMMKGHKWQLFVLDLSFIGWYIVGALCLGVGTLWVYPYHYATRVQFYESIKGEEQA